MTVLEDIARALGVSKISSPLTIISLPDVIKGFIIDHAKDPILTYLQGLNISGIAGSVTGAFTSGIVTPITTWISEHWPEIPNVQQIIDTKFGFSAMQQVWANARADLLHAVKTSTFIDDLIDDPIFSDKLAVIVQKVLTKMGGMF